jgi:RNA methyltransferase, TrmH family
MKPMLITSLSNPRIKAAVKLRDRRGRDDQGRIVIDGTREIGRAIDGGVRIVELFVCDELLDADSEALVRRAAAEGAQRLDVTPSVMEKLVFGQRVEGVLAIAETPQRRVADLDVGWDQLRAPTRSVGRRAPAHPDVAAESRWAGARQRRAGPILPPLIAVLVGMEKPGNVGAVLRTADAAGVSALVVADGGTDLYNPNAIRASLGAIFTLPVCAATSAEALAWLRKIGCQIVAARVDGGKPYTEIDLRLPTAIVLGSEAHGLSDHWRGDDITAASLPMLGRVDSLNVAATAAVLFYEVLRQRT